MERVQKIICEELSEALDIAAPRQIDNAIFYSGHKGF